MNSPLYELSNAIMVMESDGNIPEPIVNRVHAALKAVAEELAEIRDDQSKYWRTAKGLIIENDRLSERMKQLETVEWIEGELSDYCPWCNAADHGGHKADCVRANPC